MMRTGGAGAGKLTILVEVLQISVVRTSNWPSTEILSTECTVSVPVTQANMAHGSEKHLNDLAHERNVRAPLRVRTS